jgi:hypothetical protein
MSSPEAAAAPAAGTPAPTSDADRAWVHARAAELGHAGPVHDGPPAAGPDGRIVLSPDAAAPAEAAMPELTRLSAPARDSADSSGAASVLAVHAIRVGDGQSLVVRSPDGRPVKVLAAALEVADGGQVVLETRAELHAARATFADQAPIVLVGADGRSGRNGGDGGAGERGWAAAGGNGGPGEPGESGQPGPGGTFFFDHLAGTLTIVAGGGSGGNGGNGGRGGDGSPGGRTSEGGNGGNGGNGGAAGSAGDGGTVVISFRTIDPDASIQPVVRVPRPGTAGRGGGAGSAGGGMYPGSDGAPGRDGAPGAEGAPPTFKIRVHT